MDNSPGSRTQASPLNKKATAVAEPLRVRLYLPESDVTIFDAYDLWRERWKPLLKYAAHDQAQRVMSRQQEALEHGQKVLEQRELRNERERHRHERHQSQQRRAST